MKSQGMNYRSSAASQRGVSLLVAMVMLIVLTLVGVSSMNTAIVELKMASSMQQQSLALNRANEMLRFGEDDVEGIVQNQSAFNFASGGDGYYVAADNIDVSVHDWTNLNPMQDPDTGDVYVVEYLGPKDIPGETRKISTDGRIIGGAVHTFRITSRASTGKGALRLAQSLYVTTLPP